MFGHAPISGSPLAALGGPGSQGVSPSAIASTAAYGSPAITVGPVTIAVTGIASTLAYGSPTVTPGAVTIVVSGLASTAAYGSPTVTPGTATIVPSGLASTAAYGALTITTGPVVVVPSSVSSAAAFGAATITPGAVTVVPIGVASAAAFGALVVVPPPSSVSPTGIASTAAYGSPTVTPGAVIIEATGLSSAVAFGGAELTRFFNISGSGIASTAAYGSPVVTATVDFSPTGIASTAALGTPGIAYILAPKSFGPEILVGSPSVAGDATLSYNTAYQPRRAFNSISSVMDVPRARPFKNAESEILYFGSIVAWKHDSGAGAVRELAAKPTANNLYDLAGVVAGAGMEGTNVASADYGQLYVGGMCQVRVIGHASLTAGSVLEAVAGQYYLQYVASPGQTNQFVIHEDHTSAGTVALKMVTVKIAL